MIKEACVEGFTEAYHAQCRGAGRVELCENLAVGGTTPSYGTLITCKKKLEIPVVAMIRPRGGNFTYNSDELAVMIEDIKICSSLGVHGIATGILTEENEIDFHSLEKLAGFAGNMQITFHKAIDLTGNIIKEFTKLRDSGLVHRVLTSGGAETALEGAAVLNSMIHLSGERLTIIVAGKVTSDNMGDLMKRIPAKEFHGKKIVGNLNPK